MYNEINDFTAVGIPQHSGIQKESERESTIHVHTKFYILFHIQIVQQGIFSNIYAHCKHIIC